MSERTSGQGTGGSARSGWMAAALTLLTFVPLAILGFSSVRLSSDAVEREVESRVRAAADLTAASIQREMTGLAEVVESYAQRITLIQSLADPGNLDHQRIRYHLSSLRTVRPGIATTFVADGAGILIDVVPATPSIVGEDFSYRDWYRGVTDTDEPYVSELYMSLASGNPFVVAAAAPVRAEEGADEPGRVLGILVAAYDVDTIQQFVDHVAGTQKVNLTVTDQRGMLLARPGGLPARLIDGTGDPLVRRALAGESGVARPDEDGERLLAAYAVVPGLGWTVTASVPEGTALAGVSSLRTTVLAVAGVLALALAGGLVLVLGALRGRRRAEEAAAERERTLQALVAASPDLITVLNPDGTSRTAGGDLPSILGYTPEEAEALGEDLIHPDDREAAYGARDALIRGESVAAIRFRIRHADGHWVTLEARTQLLSDAEGAPTGAISVSRDVTESVAMEEALMAAKAEADRANSAKSEFLSRMSHELRTPLNAILGFAQLLQMDDLEPEQRESSDHILKAGRHLLALIDEILDISRIEAGTMTLSIEPVAVVDILDEAVPLFSRLAADRGIEIRLSDPTCSGRHVIGDRQRLKQVLLNLLSNAVKYNRPGGAVTVGCEGLPEGRVGIFVADTGPGIPPDKMARLFTPFDRLGAEVGEIEGTGLGLALSRRLAEAMGGTLTAESPGGPGSGTTFRIDLAGAVSPVERLQAEASLEPEAAPNGRARTVLYVEDNLSNLRLVERILARHPEIELLAAMQGRLGLELAREHRPDVILLDLDLPDIPGSDVLWALRSDERTREIPVLIVTADATKGQQRRLLEAGAHGYLTKPLDVRQFLEALQQVLAESDGLAGVAGVAGPGGSTALTPPAGAHVGA